MAKQGLDIAPPPRKKATPAKPSPEKAKTAPVANDKGRAVSFDQLAENDKVQFNKRITRSTADGYEILAIRSKKKVPELLAEGLELLEAKYGKV